MKNFKLKKGVAPFRIFGTSMVLSNDNITDKIALEVIKRFPDAESKFDFETPVKVIEPKKVEKKAEKVVQEPAPTTEEPVAETTKPAAKPRSKKKRNKK